MRAAWLRRRIAADGPYLMLCLSAREFSSALAHIKVATIPEWVGRGADATTHFFEHAEHKLCAIVCLSESCRGRSAVEVAGLLVHEAVHVWQHHARDIGESHPGDEQEAYAIQHIAQELMTEFARRMS